MASRDNPVTVSSDFNIIYVYYYIQEMLVSLFQTAVLLIFVEILVWFASRTQTPLFHLIQLQVDHSLSYVLLEDEGL